MKKTIAILGIMLAFAACNKENPMIGPSVPEAELNDTTLIVNLSISRSDEFSTKASIKSTWADNDVVFIFFRGIAAPKYLELKYNAGTGVWTSTLKNNLTVSNLSNASAKQMTAVYLPYGSNATVTANSGNFTFGNLDYSGYFLKAENVAYTVSGNVLNGTLNLTAPTLPQTGDILTHFDVSGFTAGNSYKFHQQWIKPITFTGVSSTGAVSFSVGSKEDGIKGYQDGDMMSFSGVLDAEVVTYYRDWFFWIEDETSQRLYYRTVTSKYISSGMYMGLGALNNTSKWTSSGSTDLGLSVNWATCNIGASTPFAYGDYYSWGDIQPLYTSGYAQENPQNHWKTGKSDGYVWKNNRFWKSGSSVVGNTNRVKFSKYVIDSDCGTVDNYSTLFVSDDMTRSELGGRWRMPSKAQIKALLDSCTWALVDSCGIKGYRVKSNVPGYTDRSIFLPAAGSRSGTGLYGFEKSAYIWSRELSANNSLYACCLQASYDDKTSSYTYQTTVSSRSAGYSLRAIWPK